MRTVEVEQFCSWSACRMSSRFSAFATSGSTTYGSAGTANIMCRKFAGVVEVVLRVDERLADRLLVRERGDRRDLGEIRRAIVISSSAGSYHVERVGVVARERADHRAEDRHRVRGRREPVEEALHVLVDEAVAGELLGPAASSSGWADAP
jgi:hypothetical protein